MDMHPRKYVKVWVEVSTIEGFDGMSPSNWTNESLRSNRNQNPMGKQRHNVTCVLNTNVDVCIHVSKVGTYCVLRMFCLLFSIKK